MTRAKFEKEIALRSGIKRDVVKEVIKIEEELVFELIASEESIRYLWGTIGGKDKKPQRVAGGYRLNYKTIANGGWTYYKHGVPYIKWSKIAEEVEERPCEEYFEQDNVKYTSLARLWRQETHKPEIPEYLDVPEEEVKRLCKKADAALEANLTSNQRKLKQMQYAYNLRQRIASRYFWRVTGYTPMGALHHEDLGSFNYEGPQRDRISTLKAAAEKHPNPLAREFMLEKAQKLQNAVDEAAEKEREQIIKAKEIEDKIRRERKALDNEAFNVEAKTQYDARMKIKKSSLSKCNYYSGVDIYEVDGKNEKDAENLMKELDRVDDERYEARMKEIESQKNSVFYNKNTDEDFDF